MTSNIDKRISIIEKAIGARIEPTVKIGIILNADEGLANCKKILQDTKENPLEYSTEEIAEWEKEKQMCKHLIAAGMAIAGIDYPSTPPPSVEYRPKPVTKLVPVKESIKKLPWRKLRNLAKEQGVDKWQLKDRKDLIGELTNRGIREA